MEDDCLKHLVKFYKDFRFRSKDRPDVCQVKCKILSKLARFKDIAEVDEIHKYLLNQLEHQSHPELRSDILKSLCLIKHKSLSNELLNLVKSQPETMVPILVRNARILPDDKDDLVKEVCELSLKYCDIQNDLTNVLWLLNRHCHRVPTSPYILEQILKLSPDLEKQLQLLLFTAVKVFLAYPAESQHILGQVFEKAHDSNSPQMRQKGEFYANLLHLHGNDLNL